MRIKKSGDKGKGFTLLELLIVVTIMGVLAAIGITQYGNVTENARAAEAYAVLSDIVDAEKAYYGEYGVYTTVIEDLGVFDSLPYSDNFDFSVGQISPVDGAYVKAAKKGTARKNYWMCIENKNKGGDESGWNPVCN